MSRPLIVTEDPVLLDELLRLAATAGVEVDVAAEVSGARRMWAAAPLVVVGPDLLRGGAAARLPRRHGVVAVGADLDDAGIWQRAVDVGAERVVFLPEAEPWLVRALGEAADPADRAGVVVATLGGRGGAGASTLAVALALAGVRRQHRTLLVDGDPWGGGLELVFGAPEAPGLRWADLAAARGRLPAAAVTDALPQLEGVGLLTWDRAVPDPVGAEAVDAVLEAARRSCDLVVVDLPRASDELSREVLAVATCALLVVPAEVRATAAAARVATHAALLCQDLRLVVRGPSPTGLTAEQVAAGLGLPLAGDLKAEPHLGAALDDGRPPGVRTRSPLRGFSERLLGELLGEQPRGSRRAA